MVNILDIDPECFMVSNAKEHAEGIMLYNLCYCDKIGVPQIVFNNIDCCFEKNGDYNFLVFCDNKKNKSMINIYLKIIKQLHNEVFSFMMNLKMRIFFFDGDSSKFRFRTNDNLVYDEKINIPVCVISLGSVIKKDWSHCPILKLQKCLYESFS